MEIETGPELARDVIEQAFDKLRVRRYERVRAARLADYEREPSQQRLDAYREADLAYLQVRGALQAVATAAVRPPEP